VGSSGISSLGDRGVGWQQRITPSCLTGVFLLPLLTCVGPCDCGLYVQVFGNVSGRGECLVPLALAFQQSGLCLRCAPAPCQLCISPTLVHATLCRCCLFGGARFVYPTGVPEPVPVGARGGWPHQRRERHLHLRAHPAPARSWLARCVVGSGSGLCRVSSRPLLPHLVPPRLCLPTAPPLCPLCVLSTACMRGPVRVCAAPCRSRTRPV
jgi:hypothetical protein